MEHYLLVRQLHN